MGGDMWNDSPADAGEAYEQLLVPAVFDEWVPRILAAGGVGSGDAVLDVACGTGVVARGALQEVGPGGSVVGLDLTEAMLRAAERVEPAVEWRLGDATDLPFDSESFDVVLSQAGLMFFPDRVAAVSEMRRVLRPGGSVAVSVWGSSPAQTAIGSLVEQHAGPEMATRYMAPWSFPNPEDLLEVMRAAGFADAEVSSEGGASRYSSMQHFMAASTAVLLAGMADASQFAADVEEVLAPYRTPEGGYDIPGPANIAIASKA
jgi:SAM-dependent methyltransferase